MRTLICTLLLSVSLFGQHTHDDLSKERWDAVRMLPRATIVTHGDTKITFQVTWYSRLLVETNSHELFLDKDTEVKGDFKAKGQWFVIYCEKDAHIYSLSLVK